MNEKLKGLIAGILIGTSVTGGFVFAKSAAEYIEVIYSDIKVYKDNVLCELKDANGTVIEPFIYNGTTYMPVRGTANIAGMDVEWDGQTKSVYLWDEIPMKGTYLLDVCPPYEMHWDCSLHSSSNGESFEMAGEKYSNGLTVGVQGRYALFNLNSKFSSIECTVGHVSENQYEKTVYFFVDGKMVKQITIGAEELPKKVSIPVNYGLQLKIMSDNEDERGYIGIGNIMVN